MSTCSICYERFSVPVSLPCGHVFCKECIRRCVDSAKSNSKSEPSCPTCRVPYPILSLDPTLIPPYLRSHFLPAIRPLFIDSPGSSNSSSSLPTPPPTTASSPASNTASTSPSTSASAPSTSAAACPALDSKILAALHLTTATWRRRAETHAAANSTLLAFSRSARDCALRLRGERDAARTECVVLKRKLAELRARGLGAESRDDEDADHYDEAATKEEEEEAALQSPSPFAQRRPPPAPLRLGLPLFVLQCQSLSMPETTSVIGGPPLKRRRPCESESGDDGPRARSDADRDREAKRPRYGHGVPDIADLLA